MIGAQPSAWAPWMRVLRAGACDQAQLLELAEGLADLGDQRAARHGDDDVRRQPPAELLGDLVGVALGALGVERAEVDVDEPPAVLAGDLRAQPIDVVVGPFDADDARAVDAGAEDLGRLEVVGDQDHGGQASGGGLGGGGVGQVPGRRAGDGADAELERLRDGDRDDAILERERRVADRVVLDPDLLEAEPLGQAIGAHERRHPDLLADGRRAVERQQLGVAPHRSGARLDRRAGQHLADARVVVGDLERSEAHLADVNRRLVIGWCRTRGSGGLRRRRGWSCCWGLRRWSLR